MKKVICLILSFLIISLSASLIPSSVQAKEEILGIHILNIAEIETADKLFSAPDERAHYITVPLTLNDLSKKEDWQRFFDQAYTKNMHPIIRLTTTFENGSWTVPTRSDIIAFARFLDAFDWHREQLIIILFNEPNHAKEWGGTIDPAGFARISTFAANWFKTENKRYVVLPAAMDLAAPTGKSTKEAFAYWKEALSEEPELLEKFDGWNSHSYPNPAFSSSPLRTDKMSLRGYTHELSFIRTYTQKDLPVYITETGWDQREISKYRLISYFKQAFKDIWAKDDRVIAVTPFLLQGAPGAFASFSFLDASGKPTGAYEAYQSLLQAKR